MRRFIYMLLMMLCFEQLPAQSATEIKAQISKIRRSTNWDDPTAAKKANAKIDSLSKKMAQANRSPSADTMQSKMQDQALEEKFKMIDQAAAMAAKGKQADMDMAKPLREEIKEIYKEEENPRINPKVMEEVDLLTLNMSLPHTDKLIEQMPNFTNIRRLIITCYAPVPVDLMHILKQAATYPLEELYVFNFEAQVSTLPMQVGNFTQLKILQLSNNRLKQLPASLKACTSLQELYLSFNPTQTIFPVIADCKQLQMLGVEGTGISSAELQKITTLIPNCKILQ
jgi:Leucine-rich repeat (LRR) protein